MINGCTWDILLVTQVDDKMGNGNPFVNHLNSKIRDVLCLRNSYEHLHPHPRLKAAETTTSSIIIFSSSSSSTSSSSPPHHHHRHHHHHQQHHRLLIIIIIIIIIIAIIIIIIIIITAIIFIMIILTWTRYDPLVPPCHLPGDVLTLVVLMRAQPHT